MNDRMVVRSILSAELFLLLAFPITQSCNACGKMHFLHDAVVEKVMHVAEDRRLRRRHLVWSTAEEVRCSDELFTQMQKIRGPTMDTCLTGSISWDPDDILVASYVFTIAVAEIFGEYLTQPEINYVAQYNSGGGTSLTCQDFDRCVLTTETSVVTLRDQYSYDCSNVYCGPRAVRSCTGETQNVPCARNLASSPEIPSFESIQCQKYREFYATPDQDCSPCTSVDGSEPPYHQFTCSRTCTGCFSDETDVHTRTIERRYFPSGTSILQCITLNDNQDEECWRINYGEVGFQVIDGTSAPVYLSNDCQSWWNGMECTCAVCGYDERGEPMIRGDCSQPSAVQNGVFDWCTATFSGVFADYADYNNGFDEGVAPLGQAGSSVGANLSASVTSAVDFNVGLVMLVVYTVLLAI